MLNQFSRTQLLLGAEAMEKLKGARVAVFGIGGVGGYVCEGLVRSGVGAFDLVDGMAGGRMDAESKAREAQAQSANDNAQDAAHASGQLHSTQRDGSNGFKAKRGPHRGITCGDPSGQINAGHHRQQAAQHIGGNDDCSRLHAIEMGTSGMCPHGKDLRAQTRAMQQYIHCQHARGASQQRQRHARSGAVDKLAECWCHLTAWNGQYQIC